MSDAADLAAATATIEALRREVERLQVLAQDNRGLIDAVLESSPHGVLVCDARGEITLQNRASERIWAGSATAKDIEGWGKYRAFHPDGTPFAPGDWSMARCLLRGEMIEAEEVHFQRFDDTHGMLLGSCAPIRGPDGSVQGAVSVFADITRFKEAEQLKDRWVATATHELRTPLTVLKAQADLLERRIARGEPVDLAALHAKVAAQIARIDRLVEDMLDASRAHAGTLEVERAPVDVVDLVHRVAAPLVETSPQHHLVVDADGPVTASADAARLEQVVANLVANALRYSDGGVVRVVVERGPHEANVHVVDNGRGFTPAFAHAMFQPYFQGDRAKERRGGLGLGLFLARELLHRMGGRIWAHSDGPGRGATFTFALPLASTT